MGRGTEPELTGGASGGARPLVRRLLWVVGTGLAFVVLAVLGLGLGSLFSFGESPRSDPEPAPPARPAARPPPADPPPAPAVRPPPPPAAPTAAPRPAEPPPVQRPLLPGPTLSLPARLRARRELIRDLGALKDELGRCPSDPVSRPPGVRAALVLDTVAEADAVRVVGSRLEAEGPVNDRFVSCARSVLEGKRLAAGSAPPGTQLRIFLPLGPRGNSLSLPSASLAEAQPP